MKLFQQQLYKNIFFYLCQRFLQEFETNTDTDTETDFESDESDEEEINNFVKELANEKNIKINSVEIHDLDKNKTKKNFF